MSLVHSTHRNKHFVVPPEHPHASASWVVFPPSAPPPQPPTPETVHLELNSCVDPIPDSGPKEGECVPGRNYSLPNDSLHEKEEYGRKITSEKCNHN